MRETVTKVIKLGQNTKGQQVISKAFIANNGVFSKCFSPNFAEVSDKYIKNQK